MARIIPIVAEQATSKRVSSTAGLAGTGSLLTTLPPLSLYIHVPWCVRKCPYCDFNSHQAPSVLPEEQYLEALQADLEQALPSVWGRQVHTVFIGGGTPSLLSEHAMDRLLSMLRMHLNLWPDAEITIEANPGTAEANRLLEYVRSGVNRISLGIQSFDSRQLKALGRVHDADQARAAIEMAQRAVARVNLDLMFALPQQTLEESIQDAREALSFGTEHLSMYQLSIEPNTVFAKFPPALPEDDLAVEMENAIESLCGAAGLERYEVSAFAKAGARARHNLNYWQFGDYLGLGPGAHGKLSFPDKILRQARTRSPDSWMQSALQRDGSHIVESRTLDSSELPFEFMLNALRLREGVPASLYPERCGRAPAGFAGMLAQAVQKGLLMDSSIHYQATPMGWRFLNELQGIFLS
jgi:putative oxygen-independent coproporphyrinogen III oxidase